MSDEEALMRSVIADPDDDTARLAAADWYDENDHPERAEWLRLGVEYRRLPKPGEGETIADLLRRADIEKRQTELRASTDCGSWLGWINWLYVTLAVHSVR